MPPKRAKAAPSPSSSDGAAAAAAPPPLPDLEDVAFPAAELPALRAALLGWYGAHHRVLPWRRNPPGSTAPAGGPGAPWGPAPEGLPPSVFAYRVWVSEVMSQQTQVGRAAAYFQRWVARWPDAAALAAASQDEVNEAWAGLGYYRRARYLLEGARAVVARRGGAFPTASAELLELPGVGAYTAAAVASIAGGERAAVVDGNVVRVLARLRRVAGNAASGAGARLFAALAAQALDPDRPGDFNQAVMELGATVCVPNAAPACGACPLAPWCGARAAAAAGGPPATDYPLKMAKAEKREEAVAVAAVRLLGEEEGGGADAGGGALLLVKRPPGGLLAGLWELPLVPVAAGAARAERRAAMDAYLSSLLALGGGGGGGGGAGFPGPGLRVEARADAGEAVHVFSHIRMTMAVERLVLRGAPPPRGGGDSDGGAAPELQWVPAAEVAARGLSSGVRKALKLAEGGGGGSGGGGKRKPAPPTGQKSVKAFFKPAE